MSQNVRDKIFVFLSISLSLIFSFLMMNVAAQLLRGMRVPLPIRQKLYPLKPVDAGNYRIPSPPPLPEELLSLEEPSTRAPKKRAHFLILSGCSFAFGQGLEARQTFGAEFNRSPIKYRTYVYAKPGAGVAAQLLTLRTSDLKKDISEAKGRAVYVFIPDHLHRFFGSFRTLTGAEENFYKHQPFLKETRPGHFESSGTLADEWDFSRRYLSWVNKLPLFKVADFNYPRRYSLEQIRQFTRAVLELRDEISQKVSLEAFSFVLYPSVNFIERKDLLISLEEAQIPYLDYTDWNLSLYLKDRGKQRMDNHPSANAVRFLTPHWIKDLGLMDRGDVD